MMAQSNLNPPPRVLTDPTRIHTPNPTPAPPPPGSLQLAPRPSNPGISAVTTKLETTTPGREDHINLSMGRVHVFGPLIHSFTHLTDRAGHCIVTARRSGLSPRRQIWAWLCGAEVGPVAAGEAASTCLLAKGEGGWTRLGSARICSGVWGVDAVATVHGVAGLWWW